MSSCCFEQDNDVDLSLHEGLTEATSGDEQQWGPVEVDADPVDDDSFTRKPVERTCSGDSFCDLIRAQRTFAADHNLRSMRDAMKRDRGFTKDYVKESLREIFQPQQDNKSFLGSSLHDSFDDLYEDLISSDIASFSLGAVPKTKVTTEKEDCDCNDGTGFRSFRDIEFNPFDSIDNEKSKEIDSGGTDFADSSITSNSSDKQRKDGQVPPRSPATTKRRKRVVSMRRKRDEKSGDPSTGGNVALSKLALESHVKRKVLERHIKEKMELREHQDEVVDILQKVLAELLDENNQADAHKTAKDETRDNGITDSGHSSSSRTRRRSRAVSGRKLNSRASKVIEEHFRKQRREKKVGGVEVNPQATGSSRCSSSSKRATTRHRESSSRSSNDRDNGKVETSSRTKARIDGEKKRSSSPSKKTRSTSPTKKKESRSRREKDIDPTERPVQRV